MADARYVFTRREFLRGALIAGAGMTLPAFLTEAVSANAVEGHLPGFKDDRILVVIQLGGGNDGLNTIVPYGDDAYYRSRQVLRVERQQLLRLDDQLAMNDAMTGLKELYDEGGLGIVNGVGYPNPNRSHFRSMEIWQTAVDSDRYSETGWVGRYFDHCCSGTPEPQAGVHVGPGEMPQAFTGRSGAGVGFTDPERFRWATGGVEGLEDAFARANQLDTVRTSANETDNLDFLRHMTNNAVIASEDVQRAGRTRRQPVDYPASALANQLRTIATLIAGGLPTRIYYTSLTGFDTHANQSATHRRLLEQFSGALPAFLRDLKKIGVADRVQVMCFSEFGRRVEENASRGTDHGTAGPMFLAGAGITPGLHGQYPSLTDLDGGDLRHTVDFRSVYTDVLEGWFGADASRVVGRKFQRAGIVKG